MTYNNNSNNNNNKNDNNNKHIKRERKTQLMVARNLTGTKVIILFCLLFFLKRNLKIMINSKRNKRMSVELARRIPRQIDRSFFDEGVQLL